MRLSLAAGDMMISFDEAMNRVLDHSKYDILTGRAPDLGEQAGSLVRNFTDRFVLPLLRRINISIPEAAGAGISLQLIYGIFILAAIVIIFTIIYFVVKNIKKRKNYHKILPDIFEGIDIKRATSENLLEEAALLAKQGRYREAVRYDYIALLFVLNARGILHLSDSKTNNQLRREVKSNAPELLRDFTSLVNVFNYTWFGHKFIDINKYDENRFTALKLMKVGVAG